MLPQGAPAERALHQLDVYKTPLLPTRMRSSNLPASITATTTPDMFKRRRPSHLILMQDDKDRLGKKTGKSPVVNETKPYAGEGGMKKLLARRKLEEDLELENDRNDKADPKDNASQEDRADQMAKEIGLMGGDTSHYNLPPLTAASLSGNKSGSDWFTTASGSSVSTSGSCLRVGRAKTSRNHIQRPSRARFSAVYEDDVDDSMEDDRNRRTEREELEEAARKAPLFNIHRGFSFANDTSVCYFCYFPLFYPLILSRPLQSNLLIWKMQESCRSQSCPSPSRNRLLSLRQLLLNIPSELQKQITPRNH